MVAKATHGWLPGQPYLSPLPTPNCNYLPVLDSEIQNQQVTDKMQYVTQGERVESQGPPTNPSLTEFKLSLQAQTTLLHSTIMHDSVCLSVLKR